jgi:hypothetical protein
MYMYTYTANAFVVVLLFHLCCTDFVYVTCIGEVQPKPPNALLTWCSKKANTLKRFQKPNSSQRMHLDPVEWPHFKVPIPNASFSKKPSLEAYQLGSVDSNVYFWDPPVFWPDTCPVFCIHCNSTGAGINRQWPSRQEDGACIPIYAIGRIDWLYCAIYRHKECPKGKTTDPDTNGKTKQGDTCWNTINDNYLCTLPPYVVQQLPGASYTTCTPKLCCICWGVCLNYTYVHSTHINSGSS